MVDEDLPAKRSRVRQEIEALLERGSVIQEGVVSVACLDGGEVHHFNSYPEALEFLKGRKGRWYITMPAPEHKRDER
ncbi:MAG: hypothetical protein QUS08_05145 [Methanothrix sp.]|nr:hypothetical protein [Methanothrix sp.]